MNIELWKSGRRAAILPLKLPRAEEERKTWPAAWFLRRWLPTTYRSEIPTLAKNARVGHPQSWWPRNARGGACRSASEDALPGPWRLVDDSDPSTAYAGSRCDP